MASNSRVARITAATRPLTAQLSLSGDKSVSIRRALFSLFTSETIRLTNYGSGEDCRTALLCLEALGKRVVRDGDRVTITHGPRPQAATLDCRNSGTTARLIMGLLAGAEGEWSIVGDESLSTRPMERVAAPLRTMGAQIELAEGGRLPARLRGTKLRGATHDLTISSAQVKSAILLAGLSASGETRVREPLPSRDHTERLLRIVPDADGYLKVDDSLVTRAGESLRGAVPGDISSAAFWVVAALLVPQSDITIENVLLNPLRTAWLKCLKSAGAEIDAKAERETAGEPVGTIRARHSSLAPLRIGAADVPGLIDEIPALAVLASTIDGESVFEQVGELRVKECDRLAATVRGLNAIGARAACDGDTLRVHGGTPLCGAKIQTEHDHRIAMAFSLAGLAANGTTTIEHAECAEVSYPEFFRVFDQFAPDSLTISE